MNKILAIDSLYDVFKYGTTHQISPISYFPYVFKNTDFVSLLNCKPHNLLIIKSIIDSKKKSKNLPNDNQIRYLAYIIVSFMMSTSMPLKRLLTYIDPKDIFERYHYYHVKDEQEVIFELMIRHNEKYKIRKMNFAYEDDLLTVKDNLIRLFPLKRFEQFKEIIDTQLRNKPYIFYIKEDEILFCSDDLTDNLNNDYFKNKFLIGNKIYCFSYKPFDFSNINIPSSLYYFYIKGNHIYFYEPGGLERYFEITN